jgi:hypothetical protein
MIAAMKKIWEKCSNAVHDIANLARVRANLGPNLPGRTPILTRIHKPSFLDHSAF